MSGEKAEKLARRMADSGHVEIQHRLDVLAKDEAATWPKDKSAMEVTLLPYATLLVECEERMAAIEAYRVMEVSYDQFAYERLQENYREAVRPWLTKLRALLAEEKR